MKIEKCYNCGEEYECIRPGSKIFFCNKPKCKKAKSRYKDIHKKVRRCANCGRYYMPTKKEPKKNSYCPHPICQEERIDFVKHRCVEHRKKFAAKNPKYNRRYYQHVEDFQEFRKKKCSCGNKIRLITSFPYSEEAPSRPHRCEKCRTGTIHDGLGLVDSRSNHRIDGDWIYL